MAADHRKNWILGEGDRIRCADADYIISGSPIGYGGSAIVYPARRTDTRLNYVIKECFPREGDYHRVEGAIVPREPGDSGSARLLSTLIRGTRREQRIGQIIHNNGDRAVCIREQLRPRSVVTGGETFRNVGECCFTVLDQLDRNTVSFDTLLEQIAGAYAPEERRRTRGLPDIHTTACIMEEVLTALEQVHSARDPEQPQVSGYYFGDLHGGNVYFSGSCIQQGQVGRARLIDFGSAWELDGEGWTQPLRSGELFAAEDIRAPELLQNGTFRLRRSADLYSAGCLMLRCVMEQVQLESYPELLCVGEDALSPRDADRIGCSREHLPLLNEILDRATAYDEARRYQTAGQMLEQIRKLKTRTAPLKNQLGLRLSTLPEGAFQGRERDFRTLDRLLRDRRKPVVIHGFPGIGKTELAIEYGRRRSQQGRVYFVRFAGSFLQTITGPIADAFSGYSKTLPNGRPKPQMQICREVLQLLGQCGEDEVLMIDHVDCPSGVFAELRSEEYRSLCALPMHLILTTRCESDGEGSWHQVDSLEPKQLLAILERYVSYPAPRLLPLIEAVGRHTLMVDLMGRTMRESLQAVTPEQLLEAMAAGSDAQLPQVGTTHDRSSSQLQLHGHLRALFDLSGMQADERMLLRCATLIPGTGMDAQLFCQGLREGLQDTALTRLTKTGWLTVSDGGVLQIHPVVRELCRAELSPGGACADFLDRLWDRYGRSAYRAEQDTQLAECYATALELPELQEPTRVSRAGMIFRKVGLFPKSAEYAQLALELARKQLRPDSPVLAQLYENLAAAWGDLREGDRELECLRQAMAIQVRAGSVPALEKARTYSNLGSCYGSRGDYGRELELQKEALKLRRPLLPPDHPDLADSYSRVGGAMCHTGDVPGGLRLQKRALELRERCFPADHPTLADSHINIASACHRLGRSEEALDHLLEALRIREASLPELHPDLAQSHRNLGILYHRLGNWQKSMEHYRKCLQIRRQILSGDDPLLHQACTEAAAACRRLGDYENELEYTLELLELKTRRRPADHPSLIAPYRNVAQVYARLGDKAQQRQYLHQAARAGDLEAMRSLGELHIVEKRFDEGIALLSQALRQGDPGAAYDLGQLYLGSPAVPRDLKRGIRLLEQAAGGDHLKANQRLGRIFLGCDPKTRDEVEVDPQRALGYLQRARQLGAEGEEPLIEQARTLCSHSEKTEI